MTSNRMTVRRPAFAYPSPMPGHWNPQRPEFSHIVNAASLAMPYLEPYLIKSMRAARERINDAQLQKDLDEYVAQESMHFSQHRRFNDTLQARGYRCIEALQARLAADYAQLAATRSLEFNLAYAEGFESMALAIGEMLIEDREHLFGASEGSVASLVLWHFVEEIEHKNVAFDVFEHVAGGYFRRVYGFLYATTHIFMLTRGGYHALLEEDGLWQNLRSRLALARVLTRIFRKLTPRLLRILVPGYSPRQVADPPWALAWARLFAAAPHTATRLDTTRLDEAEPATFS
ncbi:MAG: metal-dependent hydrolase [Gammaproteobacteria bacterium]|nr:metal-dependent hydrolase [Gammaproteobacteria bacterium]MCC6708218.1 metal-dependent hydrolase [Gammaproteobacteria bacterium]